MNKKVNLKQRIIDYIKNYDFKGAIIAFVILLIILIILKFKFEDKVDPQIIISLEVLCVAFPLAIAIRYFIYWIRHK